MIPRNLAVLLALCLVACGGQESSGGGGSGGAGGGGGAGPLPDVCVESPEEAASCEAVPGLPTAVVCQGAPPELILDHHCDYQSTVIGLGNLYCCP